MNNINYTLLPEHIRGGTQRWIEHGVPPGDFLIAVISNNLTESFARADDINILRMFDIVSFFYNEAPAGCHGSKKIIIAWMKMHEERRKKEKEIKDD